MAAGLQPHQPARRSPCTRSPPGTSRTAGRCGTRRPAPCGGCCTRCPSARAGRTTSRRSALEEGFRAGDPRFAIGVALEALVRVTRLACAIGLHTGMTVAEAARRFEDDAHLAGPAAPSEARRGTFDPTYGRYTWGKLEILDLRERARRDWGAGFSLPGSTRRCSRWARRRWGCCRTRSGAVRRRLTARAGHGSVRRHGLRICGSGRRAPARAAGQGVRRAGGAVRQAAVRRAATTRSRSTTSCER